MTNLTSSTCSTTSSSSSSSLPLSSNSCCSLRGGVTGQRKRERDEGKDEGEKGQMQLRIKTLPPSISQKCITARLQESPMKSEQHVITGVTTGC